MRVLRTLKFQGGFWAQKWSPGKSHEETACKKLPSKTISSKTIYDVPPKEADLNGLLPVRPDVRPNSGVE